MEKNPEKFLYIYLQDMTGNPKLCFKVCPGPLPKNRKSYARTLFESLEKEAALKNVIAIDDVGFYILTRLLLEIDLKKGRFWAMIVYPSKDEGKYYFDVDEEIYREGQGGDFYTFLPLKPFDTDLEKMNTDENSRDALLWMRTGRIVANALLD